MNINVDLIYPIGSLYLTTSTISPSVLFGGTWERIKNDAYLKIATGDSAGTLGGTSSNHKIPVSSMPAHNHTGTAGSVVIDVGKTDSAFGWHTSTTAGYRANAGTLTNTGGGQAYYPYYYQIFVWKRTA